jgi:peptidoglycan/xylan/chitin deacetylase (PgdA/CDA1 family)
VLHRCHLGSVDRRDFLALLGAGLLSALTGCRGGHPRAGGTPGLPSTTTPQTTVPQTSSPAPTTTAAKPVATLTAIPVAQPGRAEIVTSGPPSTKQVALTIDDGYCEACVDGYVAFAEGSGIQLTLAPNGAYHQIWDRYASRLSPLVADGQVQIANHTWAHRNLLALGDKAIRDEIERNEEWIQRTFGITARPWFRPPYGRRNARTDEIAGGLGYTRILMWNATLGDATLETPDVLMGLARQWVRPGAIVLGHANHPTVLGLFDQLQQLFSERGLRPVTIDAMFGTSRSIG